MINYFKSLKFKILFYCFSFATIILSMITAVLFFTFNTLLKSNNIQTTSYNLRIAMDNIENNVISVANVANWASVNTTISIFASAKKKYPNDLKFKTLSAYNALKNQIYSLGVDDYINKIIIYSENGSSIQFGSTYGHTTDVETAISTSYFDTLKNAPTIKWLGIFKEPFKESNKNLCIPIVKNIHADFKQEPLGWIFIAMSTDVITDFLKQYEFDKDSQLYLKIGDNIYDISNRKDFFRVDTSQLNISNITYKTYKNSKYIDFIENGKPSTAVYYTSPETGWTLIQTLSDYQFTLQHKVYARLLYFVGGGIILLAVFIFVTVSKTINPPIHKILRRINLISEGDFSYDPSIESENEIGHIGIGINKMALNIKNLIDEKVKDEKTRKNLELKMLQNQINPHFLYNTLNSIKWMATIQKATGISEMVSSLAILLKNIAKGTDELITLEQEIALLDEYCTIQKYRSGGLFNISYHFENPEYKMCKIIKFTLQPIVENAIFHGIEPKGGGTINIYITRPSENVLQISVRDDGVGMNEEQIRDLMENCTKESKRFNNIGIKNVDERLKLTFGDMYGVKVDSKLGEYTNISITLPFNIEINMGE